MANPHKVEVVVDGIKYTLVADAEDDRTIRVASYVDSKIAETKSSGARLNQNMAYVLSMMNITGELFDMQDKYDSLVEESKEPIRKFQTISEEAERVSKEKEELEESVVKLKDDLVSSLNTISDINNRYSKLKEENESNLKVSEKKSQEIDELMNNLSLMQEEMSGIEKQYQEIVTRLEELGDK